MHTTEDQIKSSDLLDSKTGQLDDILSEKLSAAFHKQTSMVVLHDVAKIASEHSPIDLAYAAPRLPSSARPVLYENLADLEAKIEFMVNTDSSTRGAVFRHLTDLEVKSLIEKMPPDEAVKVLEDIVERRFRRVVDMLETDKATRIKEIKKHQRNTAGRLMTNEFFAFPMEMTTGEAAAFIRNNPGIDLTRKVFVLGAEKQLQGYVPARNLIVNPHHLPLKQVMRPILHKVSPETSREEVVDIVERYKISALPVVDSRDFLLGVVTYENVVEAIEDIADETIASMAGTAEDVSENEPLIKRFFARAPWLVVTLLAGLINVGVISSFQAYEGGALTFVLFFIPLITGMSGNIGIQSSTVFVRSMAIGTLSPGNRGEAVVKEIVLGLITGFVFGVICGFLVYTLDFLGMGHLPLSPAMVGCVVAIGLFGACVTGSLLGALSPLFFARIGVDPALASGPIITAFNDFLSMTTYFLIAIGLTSLFL
ncbi:MAG: magnesium transporter [Chlamydiales bacterium]|nr:magnesium transporter [Chlamydiales bacterium]